MAFISVHKLSKRFGSRLVLDGVSFDLEQGELVGVLGPSGCGKTTLLRVLAGLCQPEAGKIWIDDKLVNDPHILVPPQERGVGLVFQDLALWPHLTVGQQIDLVMRARLANQTHCSSALSSDTVELYLNLAELPSELSDYYPHQLSGGQQQRLALARVMAQRPRILLLDEPLNNLDAQLRSKLKDKLRAIHQEFGLTTLYVTHEEEELKDLVERKIYLATSKRGIIAGTRRQ